MRRLLMFGLVGFAAQLVDGSLGMAYGATSTTLLLTAGLAPAIASASVHLAEVGTTLASGLSHWRFGNVDWRIVLRLALPGAAGAFVGAVLLSGFSTAATGPWMALILFTLGVIVMVRFARGTPAVRSDRLHSRRLVGSLGIVAGFVDATGGGGWGPIATPTLLASGRIEPRKVVGSVDTSEFIVSLAASAGFLIALGAHSLDIALVTVLLCSGVLAAPLAAWLVRIVPAHLLGVSVGGLIIVTNARTLLAALGVDAPARAPFYVAAAVLWVTAILMATRSRREIAV